MQGRKQFVDKVVLRFRLSERVPKQNLCRRLAELLDGDFLYPQTQSLYSHTGQPSLDPVVFCKLLLVSRLEKLVSDRQLIEHCRLRLDILYFLGYEIDEDLPWHSTSSRTRQLFPATVFEQLFPQCVAAGLVTGHTQAVDSAPVKANASLEGLGETQAAEELAPSMRVAGESVAAVAVAQPNSLLASPAHHLRRVATAHARYTQHNSGPLGRGRPQARLLSNKMPYSPADPDARIAPSNPVKHERLSAHKTMRLTAIAFTLKKRLKYQPKQTQCLAIALPVTSPKSQVLRCWRWRYCHHNRLGNERQE